jgi:hypothetical protein
MPSASASSERFAANASTGSFRSAKVPTPSLPAELQTHRHQLPTGRRVLAEPILGGLHHEYLLDRAA